MTNNTDNPIGSFGGGTSGLPQTLVYANGITRPASYSGTQAPAPVTPPVQQPATNKIDIGTVEGSPQKPTIPTDTTGTTIAQNTAPILSASDQAIKDIQTKQQQADQAEIDRLKAENDPSTQALKQAQDELATKGETQLSLEQQAGIPQQKAKLAELSGQIQNLSASYQAGLTDVEGKPIPMQFITGQQAQLQKQYASQMGMLTAQAQYIQGNITAAQDSINRTVDLHYSDVTQKIENAKYFLDQNKTLMTSAQKKLADDKSAVYDQQLKDINTLKDDKKTLLTTAIQNGASTEVQKAIMDATDYAGAVKAGGESLATGQNEIVKLGDGSTILINKNTGKVVKSYGGGDASIGSDMLGGSVVRTVAGDNGQIPVSGYTMVAGDDPYLIAQQYGTDMAGLKKLNPNIKDWTKIQPGAVLNIPNEADNWLKGKTEKQINSYNAIPDADKESIKELVNGDALLTDIVKSRGAKTQGQINSIISMAAKVDPNFSINGNKIKFAAKQQWNQPNGKSFMTRSAMNTALSHMATTYTAAQALGNQNLPAYNAIANWTSKNAGNPELTSFVYDLTVLSSEIAAAYKNGNAPTDQETEKIYNQLSGSMSPTQMKGVFGEASKLMSGKLRSLAQEYKQTTGEYPTDPIIQTSALADLKGSGVDTSSIDEILKEQGYDTPNTSINADNNTLSPLGFTPLDTSNINSTLSKFGL